MLCAGLSHIWVNVVWQKPSELKYNVVTDLKGFVACQLCSEHARMLRVFKNYFACFSQSYLYFFYDCSFFCCLESK